MRLAEREDMIGALIPIMRFISAVNVRILRIGSSIAWVALALMVVIILLQVIFRYVFNSALSWPDEAARFLMLWMAGLVAPLAYRHGGFVAIDMLASALPKKAALVLSLILLAISALVVAYAIRFGWGHAMGFGGNFDSSSLKIPLDWIGMESVRVKLRYMYASLLVCMILLQSVNLELILRNIIGFIHPEMVEPEDAGFEMAGAD